MAFVPQCKRLHILKKITRQAHESKVKSINAGISWISFSEDRITCLIMDRWQLWKLLTVTFFKNCIYL